MPRNFTQNHLVLLLTETLPINERRAMLAEVNSDWGLQESYRDLKKAYCSLVKVVRKPSSASLSNIIDYSHNQLNHAQA